jgi:hypothetical protein
MKYLKSIREFVETGDGLINAKMHELKDLVSNISGGQNIIYEWQNEDDHRLSVNFSTGDMAIKYEFDIDKLHIIKIAGNTMDFETDVESIDEGLEIIEKDIQMILGISESSKFINIFNEVENLCKKLRIMEKHYGVDKFKKGDPYFTTTQEQDIKDMIDDGLNVPEIVSKIKKW